MARDNDDLIDATGLLSREFDRLGGDLGVFMRVWRVAAGDQLAAHTMPTKLTRDGTLHVRCSSPMWTSEMQLHAAPVVLRRLRELLGDAAPRRLNLSTRRVANLATTALAEAGETTPTREPLPPLDDAEVGVIREAVKHVADPDLQGALERAMAATARQRKTSR